MRKDEDKASAAMRHLRDADALRTVSPDQAWHLYGFAVECAWKLPVRGTWSKVIGHDGADADLLAWVLDLFPRAGREARHPAPLHGWRPDHRYWRTGAVNARRLDALANEAKEQVPRRVVDAWSRGDWLGSTEGA